MGGSSSSSSQPQITAESNKQKAIEWANSLFDQGIGGQTFETNLVPDMHENRVSAYDMMIQNVLANSGGNGLSGSMQTAIDNGGYTSSQLGALDVFGNYSNGSITTDTSLQNAIYDNSQGSYAYDNLSHIASGAYLDGQDPYFEQVLANSLQDASNEVNMGAAAAGRYGSAVHQGNVAQELGEMSAQARLEQYMREREAQVEANAMLDAQRNANLDLRYNIANSVADNSQSDRQRQLAASQALSDQYNQALAQQMQAASQMDAERRGNLALQMEAANAMTAAQAQDYDRQLAANSQIYDAGQQSLANMQAAYSALQQPAQDLASVGAAYEEQEAKRLADEYRIFQEQQNNPWELVARMQGLGGSS